MIELDVIMIKQEYFKSKAKQLLKELLAISSVNAYDDESIIAKYIYDLFLENEIMAQLQPIDDRHANVIAFLEGEDSSQTVIWNGHIDTVAYGNLDEWKTEPFIPIEVEDKNRLYARGASDMKSGLSAMIYALITLKSRGIKPRQNICFIGTCDEEKGGLGAKKILELDLLKNVQAIIIGEPTNCHLGVAQKGCIWMELTVYGKTSHGAYPKEGMNAIQYGFEASKRLQSFLEPYSHHLLGETTAQVTMINGGIAPNMTPDVCTLLMDIRIVPNLNLQMIINALEYICLQIKEETDNKITFIHKVINHRIPIDVASDNEWVVKFKDTLINSELSANEIGINYFTDASILVKERPELPVLLFGPGEPGMAHKPNEWVAIDKYYQAIDVLLQIFGGTKL